MSQRLMGMQIDKVALVDRGANGRQFALLKRDDAPVTTDELAALWKAADAADPVVTRKGLLAKIAAALGIGGDQIAKAQTFATIVAGRELTDALYDSWYTLEDALWSAMWAVDENGADLSIEAKQALVVQNLDEFKAWLIAQMTAASAIAKADASPVERSLAALLRKAAGTDTVLASQLTKAAEPLRAAIGEMGSLDPDVTKRADAQEDAMTGEELATINKTITDGIAAAVAPIAADVAELRKGAAAPTAADPAPAPVAKADAADDEIPEGIAKVLSVLIDDVALLKGAPGQRTSLDGQADAPVRKRSSWTAGLVDA